jgi:hypothetical protein
MSTSDDDPVGPHSALTAFPIDATCPCPVTPPESHRHPIDNRNPRMTIEQSRPEAGIMNRHLLLICVSVAIAGSAHAQSVNRTWRVTNKNGTPVLVRTYQSTNADCSTGPLPTITVDKQPSDGTMTTQVKTDTVSPLRAKQCVGASVTGLAVLYTPNSGFHGVDVFSYVVSFANDKRQFHDTAYVTIN